MEENNSLRRNKLANTADLSGLEQLLADKQEEIDTLLEMHQADVDALILKDAAIESAR